MGEKTLSKELLIQDNIKDELCLYSPVEGDGFIESYSDKFCWILSEQAKRLKKYNLGRMGIYNYILQKIEEGIIPNRYTPTIKDVYYSVYYYIRYKKKTKDNRWVVCERTCKGLKQCEKIVKIIKRYPSNKSISVDKNNKKAKIIGVTFKESIISLMIQKQLDKDIISFLKELSERDKGLDFDVYIDRWANRLLRKENIYDTLSLWKKPLKRKKVKTKSVKFNKANIEKWEKASNRFKRLGLYRDTRKFLNCYNCYHYTLFSCNVLTREQKDELYNKKKKCMHFK